MPVYAYLHSSQQSDCASSSLLLVLDIVHHLIGVSILYTLKKKFEVQGPSIILFATSTSLVLPQQSDAGWGWGIHEPRHQSWTYRIPFPFPAPGGGEAARETFRLLFAEQLELLPRPGLAFDTVTERDRAPLVQVSPAAPAASWGSEERVSEPDLWRPRRRSWRE